MTQGDVHTYYEDGTWKNRLEGGVRASNTSLRRIDAVSFGRTMARKRRVTHVIHGTAGDIEEQKSYRTGT